MRFPIALWCLASLAAVACSPTPPGTIGSSAPPTSSTTLDRAGLTLTAVEQRHDRAQVVVGLVADMLPADQAAKVRAAQMIVGRALIAARRALTLADQVAQLRRAQAASDTIDAATGISTAPVPLSIGAPG